LYAVALLGTCEYERNERTYMKAAAVAEEVFAKNPQHPGAIHYLIHAYDDPIHAPLGLRAARVYGKVAGAASHAQHMPAHIFFALGMWDEAIAANVASVAVADERIKRKGLGVGDRNYHSLLWLEYAYLQEGRASEARRVLDGIQQARPLAHMSAVYAIETGDWEKPPSGLDLTQADLLTRMMVWNAEGLVDVAHGRIDEARRRGEAAKKALTQGSGGEETGHGGMAMGEAPNTHKLAEIMSEQIDTAILYATGKSVEAFEVLGRAASEEDALSFEFGPPTPLKPTHELYGELLLKAGRAKEARHEFERVLERAPGRAQAMKGLEKAQEEAGDGAAAWRLREPGKR
jgi:tetratricopeptide (TPR) repeat protein